MGMENNHTLSGEAEIDEVFKSLLPCFSLFCLIIGDKTK